MRSVLAIAGIALRAAVRSRMVLALLFILALAVPGIAATARGDGTVPGQVQVLLTYSLGACGLLLALATLWSACAAVSLEIENRHIHLLVSKPVHRWQVGAGKWLGIMILNAGLLLLAGATVAGILRHKTRPLLIGVEESARVREEVLNARRALPPRALEVRPEAERLVRAAVADGRISREEAATELRNAVTMLNITTNSVSSGTGMTWVFDLPVPLPPGPVVLEYQADTGSMDRGEVPVVWSLGGPANPRLLSIAQPLRPGARRTLELPRETAAALPVLTLECFNAAPRDVTVFFEPDTGLRLLVPGGGFHGNLVRILLLEWISLGLLAALGVTAGSLFSLPVAALASISMILIRQLTVFLQVTTGGEGPSVAGKDSGLLVQGFDWVCKAVYRTVSALSGPPSGPGPLERLSQGVLVPWSEVASAAALSLGVYGLAVFAAGAVVLTRREVALPE